MGTPGILGGTLCAFLCRVIEPSVVLLGSLFRMVSMWAVVKIIVFFGYLKY